MVALLVLAHAAMAAETVVWQGTKVFTSWSDVVNIEGSRFSALGADDVLHLSITAASGAQVQVSWGSSWTNFDGLGALGISGDYDLVVTAQDVSRLRQGIHIKGVNFTLTAVKLRTNDGTYETLAEDLFAWQDMLTSGATQGQTCVLNLKPYGGAGWYWPEPQDLSAYGSIVVKLLQPAAEAMTLQLLYGETGVKRQTIAQGATQCKLTLTSAHKRAYSLNLISEKAQTVSIGSVNVADRQGNVVPTDIAVPCNDGRVRSVEYFNAAGVRLAHAQRGINIVIINLEGGRTVVRKVMR